MRKRIILEVYGEVQGVNFRYYTTQVAQELGLKGWVKNEPDGIVKIIAEGEEKNLKELVNWSHQGPSGVRVTKVDEKWESNQGEFEDFRIEY